MIRDKSVKNPKARGLDAKLASLRLWHVARSTVDLPPLTITEDDIDCDCHRVKKLKGAPGAALQQEYKRGLRSLNRRVAREDGYCAARSLRTGKPAPNTVRVRS